jgi:hypothetical protein
VADAALASIVLRVGIGWAWPDPSVTARAIDRVQMAIRSKRASWAKCRKSIGGVMFTGQ